MIVVTELDLRFRFGVARDQGSRPTCTAFACSDAHAAGRGDWCALSCEYAFFHGHRRQGTAPYGGVHLRHVLDAIRHEGQPAETGWPYLAALPDRLSDWVPPAQPGALYRGHGERVRCDISSMCTEMRAGRAAIIVMTISDAFYLPSAAGVVDGTELADPSRVHAMLGVGRGHCGDMQLTLVRNSWGPGWGIEGHAWISDAYLAPRLRELAVISRDG